MSVIDLSELTFLIVDDNAYMRKILHTLLNGFHAGRIVEADSAETAFQAIEETSPDIVLVDWEMPTIDGIALVKRIRQSEDKDIKFLPILMISGHSEKPRVQMARDSGVNSYLVKPISAATLYNHISAIVLREQDFIDAPDYFGPDRRFKVDPNYKGEERRGKSPSGE